MQIYKCEPFEGNLENEFQDYLEGVKRGAIFGAHVKQAPKESDQSGLLIVSDLLYKLMHEEDLGKYEKRFLVFAIRAMLEGEDARKCFGLNSPPGRGASRKLAEEVTLFIENAQSKGLNKTKAVQAAAEHFHKDTRHIQRLIQKYSSDK